MHVDILEWNVALDVKAEHDHAAYPLEQEVGAGFHDGSWEEFLIFASSDVWPLAGAEPGIEGVFIAAIGVAVDFDFGLVYTVVVNPVAWVVDVLEGWNWDAPRDLAGDVPVAQILEVIDESFLLAGWMEFNLALFEDFDCLGG